MATKTKALEDVTSLMRPPSPKDSYDAMRWEHSALRRRLLTGHWENDLRTTLHREVGTTRAMIWGRVDRTKNMFRSVVNQLSVLYDQEPIISLDVDNAKVESDLMSALFQSAGYWSMATRLQKYVMGQREGFVKVGVIGDDADRKMHYRIVPADLILAEASDTEPDLPNLIREFRLRPDVDDPSKTIWTQSFWDIRDPSKPVFRILNDKGNDDLTAHYLKDDNLARAKEYPHWLDGSTPILPYGTFHAERTGDLFDAWEGAELVDGSLTVAALWVFWKHCVRDASWPQRYGINVQPAGGVKGHTGRHKGIRSVEGDPSSIMLFEDSDGKSATLSQFQPGADPSKLGEAIRSYSVDMAIDFGLSPADVERVESSARSGYAIRLSRDAIRSEQRKREPQFRRGDLQLIQLTAALWNSEGNGSKVPMEGWQVHYPGLPKSVEEKAAEMAAWEKENEFGIVSPVDLYMRVNGVTREKAKEELTRINQEKALFPLSSAMKSNPANRGNF